MANSVIFNFWEYKKEDRETGGSPGDEYEDGCLLGYCVV
jgi:hypothetical protein